MRPAGPDRAACAPRSSEAPLALGALDEIVGFHIARAAVSTLDAFERHLGTPFELRKVEFSLLMLLHANAAVSPKPLARTLRVTAPKLSLLLDGLQARGLLQRRPNPQDGRSQHLQLTLTGRRLAERAADAARTMEAELRAPLSAAEHAMLIELLAKLGAPGPG